MSGCWAMHGLNIRIKYKVLKYDLLVIYWIFLPMLHKRLFELSIMCHLSCFEAIFIHLFCFEAVLTFPLLLGYQGCFERTAIVYLTAGHQWRNYWNVVDMLRTNWPKTTSLFYWPNCWFLILSCMFLYARLCRKLKNDLSCCSM